MAKQKAHVKRKSDKNVQLCRRKEAKQRKKILEGVVRKEERKVRS